MADHIGQARVAAARTEARNAKRGAADNSPALGALQIAIERGYKFVLCVESDALSTMVATNQLEPLDAARMLERFARKERRNG